MKLILYSGIKEKRGRQLGRLIRERLPDLQVKASKSLWDLEQGVCRLLNGISVIVARVFSENELTRLLKLKKNFYNHKLILVLPEGDSLILSRGLELAPSFISYLDSDLNDILLVISKIEQQTQELNKQRFNTINLREV